MLYIGTVETLDIWSYGKGTMLFVVESRRTALFVGAIEGLCYLLLY